MTFGPKTALALVLGALTVSIAAPARADVSSWMYVGAGPAFLDRGGAEDQPFTLQLETGLGTPPAALVFGGLLRIQPYFGQGTDLALLARGATRGFVQGGWGLALDVGGYERFWGETSEGGVASLGVGMPWGVTLSATGGLGTNEHRFASVTLGIDFARLTVYRTHGTNWFMNPYATDERGRGPR